jgi:hypothetical protein
MDEEPHALQVLPAPDASHMLSDPGGPVRGDAIQTHAPREQFDEEQNVERLKVCLGRD